MQQHDVLTIEGLSARYPDGTLTVLRDISLRIKNGEILCVIGESGCGKSTLINSILRMPGRVEITSGHVLYEGRDIVSLPSEELRQLRGAGIGIIFQEPGASLDPIRKIRAQFYETLRAHEKITKAEAAKRAMELMPQMGLPDPKRILESCPVQLSGGMNQRVAIAFAMALKPTLLLADEPTSALDVTVQSQIVDELIRLRDNFGTSLLVITHNMGVVAKLADTVAVMYGGRIVEYGSRDEVLRRPVHPYTKALMDAIPKVDGTLPKGVPGQNLKNFPEKGCAFVNRCAHATEECKTKQMKPIHINESHWSMCTADGKEG